MTIYVWVDKSMDVAYCGCGKTMDEAREQIFQRYPSFRIANLGLGMLLNGPATTCSSVEGLVFTCLEYSSVKGL